MSQGARQPGLATVTYAGRDLTTVYPLLLPIAILLPFTVAAPAKILTGWSANPSLALATLVVAACATALWRIERRVPRPESAGTLAALLAIGLALAALLVWLLYDGHFWGMPNLGGPDAGSHAVFYYSFNEDVGAVPYEGCLSFHSTAWWLARVFSMNVFGAFRMVFYWTVVALPLAAAALTALVVPPRASPIAAAMTLVVVGATVGYHVWFPILHFMQAQACYPQLYALIPILLGWLLYSACDEPLARLLGSAVIITLMRYTYGLNLGDLIGGYALLAGLEAVELRGAVRRLVAAACAIGLGYAAFLVFKRLWLLREVDGPLLDMVLRPAMWGQLGGAIFLCFVPSLLSLSPAATRAIRFASCFGLVTSIVQYLYLDRALPELWYIQKYPMLGAIIVTTGLVLALCAAAGQLQRGTWRRPGLAALLGLAVSIISVRNLDVGFAVARASAAERAFGKPPYQLLRPLYNADAARFIKRTLADKSKHFGGFYTTNLPHAFFMSLVFRGPGIPGLQYVYWADFVPAGRLLTEKDACFFWDQPSARFDEAKLPLAKKVRELEAMRNKRCVPYSPRFDPPGTRSALCAVCN